MNRRKFIASGAATAALLSSFPSFALTEQITSNTTSLGKGFKILSSKSHSLSITNLSEGITQTYLSLKKRLDELQYLYEEGSIMKLNNSSYIMPLSKRSFFGIKGNGMALIIENNSKSDFYILSEKLTDEFKALAVNFDENMKGHMLNVDATDFSYPVEVVEQSTNSKDSFVYRNKFNTTITLFSHKNKTKTRIS